MLSSDNGRPGPTGRTGLDNPLTSPQARLFTQSIAYIDGVGQLSVLGLCG